MKSTRPGIAAVTVFACAVAGFVAALRGGHGAALLFAVIAVLCPLTVWPDRRRRAVSVRHDLGRWLDSASAIGAEPVDELVDRAVSRYRASMDGTGDG